ncbi:MAG TPA: NAD(P)H-binding protein [Spirochaetota bacterium]|nr:NAD(P)H-binding protein [Spirochaetota bacterium]HPS87086.1 NAD(P)H-binding protein [Spirochaetota bacterium]
MKAVIAGATGLTGSTLAWELLARDEFTEITCLVRNIPGEDQKGLVYQQTDFDMIHFEKFKADTAFTCLGTTIKNAGSRENFYRVDYHYNFMFAEACKSRGVERFVLMSALGADSQSSIFYNRVKGELEEAIINLNFKSLTIVRPSLLEGPRTESRPGELFARKAMKLLNPLLIGGLRRYRSVDVDKIASVMAEAAILSCPGVRIIENEEILTYR